MDEGETIGQIRVPILENDTAEQLAARVLKQEHILYPQVLSEIAQKL